MAAEPSRPRGSSGPPAKWIGRLNGGCDILGSTVSSRRLQAELSRCIQPCASTIHARQCVWRNDEQCQGWDLELLEDEGKWPTSTGLQVTTNGAVLYSGKAAGKGLCSLPCRWLYLCAQQWPLRYAYTAGSFHSQASDAPGYPQQMHTACWLSIPVPVLYNQRNGDTVFLSSFSAASFSASEKIGGYVWVSCESLHKAISSSQVGYAPYDRGVSMIPRAGARLCATRLTHHFVPSGAVGAIKVVSCVRERRSIDQLHSRL